MAHIGIIGAGYSGLAAAFELQKLGHRCEIFEAAPTVGGLAGSFELFPGIQLEKFYHHWFTSDTAILDLIKELGLGELIKFNSSNNGLFYTNSIFRLSSPFDLLKFNPIPFIDRVRTGLMALYARQIEDWSSLENITAEEWIRKVGGDKAYNVIWKPLLYGKFGDYASQVSAVWFWNKLKLRGGSRSKDGGERLAYYSGGFGALTDAIAHRLLELGVSINLNTPVTSLLVDGSTCKGFVTAEKNHQFDAVLVTTPLPSFLALSDAFPAEYHQKYSQVQFLGNVCLVLVLNRSLSGTYWLNVADPSFPFVGVIEHTNFDPPAHYNNRHIAYLSKYLPTTDPLFSLPRHEALDYCEPYLQRIFPEFSKEWVEDIHVWRAEYSQPLVVKNYSNLIPPFAGPFTNQWLCTMSQIYPQDRGTNYAVEYGRKVAKMIHSSI